MIQINPLIQAKNLVLDDFEQVNEAIREACQADVALISEISGHLINSGGKRLRPLLTLLSAACVDDKSNPAQAKFAAVIEFIHAATLLHDDVVDESTLRRGRSTANQQWGNQAAVLVGDFLYSRAFQMMVSLNSLPIMSLMANTTNTIAAGEVMQLIDSHNDKLLEEQYFNIIHAKTAILFSAACEGAGILAGADETQRQAFAEFGLKLGFAYQLTDDVLDYTSESEKLGKTQGDDFMEGKITLPIIHAFASASSEDSDWLKKALQRPERKNFTRVLDILIHSGAIDYTRNRASAYCNDAINALSVFTPSDYQSGLSSLVSFVTAREN